MEQIKWFDRKFDFNFQQNIFPSIIERLKGTSIRLSTKIESINPDYYEKQFKSKWTIKEQIGHLIDLEPIWQGRLTDILNNKEYLREADLQNNKTFTAGHNEVAMDELLHRFDHIRAVTLSSLSGLTVEDIYKSALHPRLKTPMRTMDLWLFVAEHDDHHLAEISQLNKNFGVVSPG